MMYMWLNQWPSAAAAFEQTAASMLLLLLQLTKQENKRSCIACTECMEMRWCSMRISTRRYAACQLLLHEPADRCSVTVLCCSTIEAVCMAAKQTEQHCSGKRAINSADATAADASALLS
jgi:hypothetical protein